MIDTHKKSRLADRTATVVLYCTAGFFLLLLAAFTIYILVQGIMAYKPVYLNYSRHGIAVEIFNTIYLVLISLIISVPIGLCAGIYMAEYAKDGPFTRFLRTCIETLSSLPSIVVGLFGYLVLIVITGSKWNLFAGAVTVSILNIPLITTTTEDAIRAVPESYREGSLGLGATHWQTIVNVVLPAAFPNIITGVILAGGRSFGEAAALLLTSGMSSDINIHNWNIFSKNCLLNPFRPADTLAVHIWALKTESTMPDADRLSNFSAAVLITIVFAFSLLSRLLGGHMEKRLNGGRKRGGK